MRSILVIDDDERLLSLITEILRIHGFDAVPAKSTSIARSLLSESNFDAMIVDWMLPHESGIEFIKSIRESASHIKNIPAIMLTAVDGIDNKVTGFESGFDDYITKPFEEMELIVRLNSLIKRTCKNDLMEIVKFGECSFNLKTGELKKSEEIISLSTTELALLKTLCQRPNQPFSRAELARKLSFQVSDRTIDVQITRLRKKIGDNTKNPTIIKTVRYVGYSISAK